ncbi:MAG: YjbH domain-containing protein [Nitrospirae bacterium]|nr:YjbH domain-containing protein [Nitrospirota bacterium]
METPTARVMKENTYRLGFSQIDPYRYYYGAISPIKRLEIDGRITEILGTEITSPGWQGYGNYKDKALDFKYQLISEGKYMPAIALGIMDPHGSRLYSSQYIVANKQIYPFDFTLGFGNGRFGKRPLASVEENIRVEIISDTTGWLKDSQFFWGIQFAPSRKYALMFEYSPIRYHEQIEPAQSKHFQTPVPSKYNLGLRWKPLKWTEVDFSYQRGNQIGVNFSMPFEIGRPLIPVYDKPYREEPDEKLSPLSERITKALYSSGFSEIGVAFDGDDLWIEVQNDRYYFTTKAIGVILRVIADIKPERIIKIHIVLKENGIPVVEFITTKEDAMDLYSEKLTFNEFFLLSEIRTDVSEMPDVLQRHKKLFRYGIKPSLQTFLNDPSGFFKYRFGASGWVSYHPWEGASCIFCYRA